MKTAAYLIIAGLALILISFLLPDCRGSSGKEETTTIKTDTIYVRDTCYIATPTPTETKFIGYTPVTLPIWQPPRRADREPKKADPVLQETELTEEDEDAEPPDSVQVSIPIEQHHYQGDNYEAWVSGYRAALDSLRVFPETRFINTTTTKEVTKWKTKRWGLSIGAGVVATPKGKIEPGIFLGASYTFLSF